MPSHSDIERRAYELYEWRGRIDGHDWQDWLQAEGELRESEPSSETPVPELEPTSAERAPRIGVGATV
jgi:hypothetical protein